MSNPLSRLRGKDTGQTKYPKALLQKENSESWSFSQWCSEHALLFSIANTILFALVTWEVVNYDELHNVVHQHKALFDIIIAIVGMLIAVIFGFYGLFGARKVEKEIVSLSELNTRLGGSITNLEEVVRLRLHGIPEILARAIQLVEHAMDELFVVTFTVRFGAVHRVAFDGQRNVVVTIPGTSEHLGFETATDRFWMAIKQRTLDIPTFRLLTVEEAACKPFLEDLQKRKDDNVDYSSLDVARALKDMNESWNTICVNAGNRERRVGAADLRTIGALPFQMILARLRPQSTDAKARYGCLVFLVGSTTAKVSEAAAGFYTELDDFISIYRNVADSLFEAARKQEVMTRWHVATATPLTELHPVPISTQTSPSTQLQPPSTASANPTPQETRSMKPTQKFDIHIASDVITPALEQQLMKLDYRRDGFAGGTQGVARPHHFSFHPQSRAEFDTKWKETEAFLSTTKPEEFFGFMEGETTAPSQQLNLPYKPFDPKVPFPFGKLQHKDCPPDKRKDFDIHVSADRNTIDPRLQDLLVEKINFYYADIVKPTGKIVRVYTFQPVGVPKMMEIFQTLADYFQKAGGLDGKIKLEVTLNYARFPSSVRVPPIITRLSENV